MPDARRLRVRRLARVEPQPERHRRPRRSRPSSCCCARDRARRPGARPLLRRPGAGAVLGATVETAPRPELGWHEIETDDPERIPAGPWLSGTTTASRSRPARPRSPAPAPRTQAFRHGRHLGVQFHPESTVEIVAGWARPDAERLAAPRARRTATLLAATEDERGRRARRGVRACSTASWRPRANRRDRGRCEGGMMGHPPELVGRVGHVRPRDLPGPARGRARQGRADRRVRPRQRSRPRVLRGRDGHRPAPHAGRRRRERLSRPRRQARPGDADAAAVGARRGLLHRRPRAGGRGLAPSRPTRAAPCGAAVAGFEELGLDPDRRARARVLPLRAGPGRARRRCGATSTT